MDQKLFDIEMNYGNVRPLAEYYRDAIAHQDWQELRILERIRVRTKYADLRYLYSKASVTLTFLYEPYFKNLLFRAFEAFDTRSLHLLVRLAERRIWRALKLIAFRYIEDNNGVTASTSTASTTESKKSGKPPSERNSEWLSIFADYFTEFSFLSIKPGAGLSVHLTNGTDLDIVAGDLRIPDVLVDESKHYILEEALVKDYLFFWLLEMEEQSAIRRKSSMDSWLALNVTGVTVTRKLTFGEDVERPLNAFFPEQMDETFDQSKLSSASSDIPTILDPSIVCARLLYPYVINEDLFTRLVALIDFVKDDALIDEQRVVLRKMIGDENIPLSLVRLPSPLDRWFSSEGNKKKKYGRYWMKRDLSIFAVQTSRSTFPHGLDSDVRPSVMIDVPVMDSRMRSVKRRAEQLEGEERERNQILEEIRKSAKRNQTRSNNSSGRFRMPALGTLFGSGDVEPPISQISSQGRQSEMLGRNVKSSLVQKTESLTSPASFIEAVYRRPTGRPVVVGRHQPTYTLYHVEDKSKYSASGVPLIPTDFSGFPERLRARFEAFQLNEISNLEKQFFQAVRRVMPAVIQQKALKNQRRLLLDMLVESDSYERGFPPPMIQFTRPMSVPGTPKSKEFQRSVQRYEAHLRWLCYHSISKKLIVDKMAAMKLFPEMDLMIMYDPTMGFQEWGHIPLPPKVERMVNRFIEELSDDLHRMILIRDFSDDEVNQEKPPPIRYLKDTVRKQVGSQTLKKESDVPEWFEFTTRYYRGAVQRPKWERMTVTQQNGNSAGFLIDRREDFTYFFRGTEEQYEPEVMYIERTLNRRFYYFR